MDSKGQWVESDTNEPMPMNRHARRRAAKIARTKPKKAKKK